MQEYCASNGNENIKNGTAELVFHNAEHDWIVHLVDTGQTTKTGDRIKRLVPWLSEKTFMLTWCDGLSDVDLDALLRFHRSHGRIATLTAVLPPARFGYLVLDEDKVVQFSESSDY